MCVKEAAVLFAEIAAPPMNLLGTELVRDLVSLIQRAEADEAVHVLVFKSADPDYFTSHVDVTRMAEYREEATKRTGEPSLALMFRYLSAGRLVTIAQIEGRVRDAGSEFVLACDMRFPARESAIFGQPEAGLGLLPGAGGIQHLARLMGVARIRRGGPASRVSLPYPLRSCAAGAGLTPRARAAGRGGGDAETCFGPPTFDAAVAVRGEVCQAFCANFGFPFTSSRTL